MKKMFNFRSLAILCLAIGLVVSLTRCKKYDDDVNRLQTQISALKADVAKDFKEKVDKQMGALDEGLKSAVARLDALEKQSASGVDVQSKIDAAKKELMDNLVSKEAYNQFVEATNAKIAAAVTKDQLDAVNTNIKSIEGRFATLEALKNVEEGSSKALNDFKAEYAKAYKLLEGDIADLTKKIKVNATAIDKLIKDLATKANKSDFDALKKRVDDFLGKDLGVQVAALKGRIVGLILQPDYVADGGGALPVAPISFLHDDCGGIPENLNINYVVNPSNADETQIKKVEFVYRDPKVYTSAKTTQDVGAKVLKYKLVNGILTTTGFVKPQSLWAYGNNPQNRVDELMLKVTLDNGSVISSDWLKLVLDGGKGKAEKFGVIVRTNNTDNSKWGDYKVKPSVASAKASVVEPDPTVESDPTVINMPYNKELDLLPLFKAMYSDYKADLGNKYGELKFAFDFKDEKGNTIVYKDGSGKNNQTDNEKFIAFANSDNTKLKVRVYDNDGTSLDKNNPNNLRASIGRTPILHVRLLSPQGCLISDGYVKVNIVDKPLDPKVREVDFTSDKTIIPSCQGALVTTIDNEKMNEMIYQLVPMSRKEFHANYTLIDNPEFDKGTKEVGKVVENPANDNNTSSYNLKYSISEDDVWNNLDSKVNKVVYYVNNNNKQDYIKLVFGVKIGPKPTVTVNRFDNYWKGSGASMYATQNVRVPKVGETKSDSCTWKNNLNNVFKTKEGTVLLKLPTGYKYHYEFAKTQYTVDGVKLERDTNSSVLKAKNSEGEYEVIAKIHPQDNHGDILEYTHSDLAERLLNSGKDAMRANIRIVVVNSCGKEVNVKIDGLDSDTFPVRFLRPLVLNVQSDGYFQDGVDVGAEGSYIDALKVVKLTDWRNYSFTDNSTYYDYYGVKDIIVDSDRSIQLAKDADAAKPHFEAAPKTIKVTNTEPDSMYRYGRFMYHNNGNFLEKDFLLKVPVKVEYEWGSIINETVIVRVKGTSKLPPKNVN